MRIPPPSNDDRPAAPGARHRADRSPSTRSSHVGGDLAMAFEIWRSRFGETERWRSWSIFRKSGIRFSVRKCDNAKMLKPEPGEQRDRDGARHQAPEAGHRRGRHNQQEAPAFDGAPAQDVA